MCDPKKSGIPFFPIRESFSLNKGVFDNRLTLFQEKSYVQFKGLNFGPFISMIGLLGRGVKKFYYRFTYQTILFSFKICISRKMI